MKNNVKTGNIRNPEKYCNWIIEIMNDTDNTGGFYLFIYNRIEMRGFDDWFIYEDQVYRQIESENIEVNWA